MKIFKIFCVFIKYIYPFCSISLKRDHINLKTKNIFNYKRAGIKFCKTDQNKFMISIYSQDFRKVFLTLS